MNKKLNTFLIPLISFWFVICKPRYFILRINYKIQHISYLHLREDIWYLSFVGAICPLSEHPEKWSFEWCFQQGKFFIYMHIGFDRFHGQLWRLNVLDAFTRTLNRITLITRCFGLLIVICEVQHRGIWLTNSMLNTAFFGKMPLLSQIWNLPFHFIPVGSYQVNIQ